jgi:hypothetical protein
VLKSEFLKKNNPSSKTISFVGKDRENLNSTTWVKTPVAILDAIETHILIRNDRSEGEIFEKTKFILKEGVFSSLVRKVSLGGTADKQLGFKLASS